MSILREADLSLTQEGPVCSAENQPNSAWTCIQGVPLSPLMGWMELSGDGTEVLPWQEQGQSVEQQECARAVGHSPGAAHANSG